MLKLLQFVFASALPMKNEFADKGGFEALVRTMVSSEPACQDFILSFMATQFQTGLDDGKDLIAAYTDGSKVKPSFNQFVKQVRNKIFKEISQEYEEKLNMNLSSQHEDQSMTNQATELAASSDRSRENSGSLLELDPNAKALAMLRERRFLDVYKDCLVRCETEKLAGLLKVIQIAQGFTTFGFFVFETARV